MPSVETDDGQPPVHQVRSETGYPISTGRLSLDHRTVLALHYIDGSPLEEVALVVGRPLGTMKSRLHAARSAFAARASRRRRRSCRIPAAQKAA